MPEQKKLLLKIFKAELEDCIEDVEELIKLYDRRHGSNEISEYVYMENEALLTRELGGLRKVILALDGIDQEQFEDLQALATAVDGMIQRVVSEFEDPQAVYGIAKKKLRKILGYIADKSV